MRGFGGMLAFELGSLEAARGLLNGVRLHALAESLGGVESLISHPATMTHASVPADRRAAIGITDGLVRISAGLQGNDHLKQDPAQALAAGYCGGLGCLFLVRPWPSVPRSYLPVETGPGARDEGRP